MVKISTMHLYKKQGHLLTKYEGFLANGFKEFYFQELEKKLHKITHNSMKNMGSKLDKGLYKEHLHKIGSQSVQWFWRSQKCEIT